MAENHGQINFPLIHFRMIYFTSDPHLSHKNIIKYCNRPFSSVTEMNDVIIKNWMNILTPKDEFVILGDFMFGDNIQFARDIINRIPCPTSLILGNHDSDEIANLSEWNFVGHYQERKWNNIKLVLCHYKFAVFNKSHHGAINLFGHSHTRHGELNNAQQCDVGVDAWNFKPQAISDLIKHMAKLKPILSIDHHGKKEDV